MPELPDVEGFRRLFARRAAGERVERVHDVDRALLRGTSPQGLGRGLRGRRLAEPGRRGWEGLIAKRADAPYVHGRSRDWLKFKCVNEQEFVIGGYTDPGGKQIGFGALLVGYHDARGRLRYAGKVGTGYSDAVLRDIGGRLARIEQEEPPFARDRLPRSGVHWVRPELVAQIGFTEVTGDGKPRHPRFLGPRRDKPPREVVLERPAR